MNLKLKHKILLLTLSALFAVLLGAVSQIAILTPVGVPITLQVAAVALCGYVLGAKWGTASVAVYILLGAVGVPVFSGFKGGIHNLFGLTGGFIPGFLVLALLCGLSVKAKPIIKILLGVFGVGITHILGVLQFSFVSKTGILESFLAVSLPYILKDILLIFAAVLLSKYIAKYLKERI